MPLLKAASSSAVNRGLSRIGPARRTSSKVVAFEPAPAQPPAPQITFDLDFSADAFNSAVADAQPSAATVAPIAAPAPAREDKKGPTAASRPLVGGKVQKVFNATRKRIDPRGQRPAPRFANYLKPTSSSRNNAAPVSARPIAMSGAASAAERRAKGAAARAAAVAPKPSARVTRASMRSKSEATAEPPPKIEPEP